MMNRLQSFVSAFCLSLLLPFGAIGQSCGATPLTTSFETSFVRALYSTGGDMWYTGLEEAYFVTDPSSRRNFAIMFAGGLWLGAKDPGGNLKVSAQTYGRNSFDFDYRPGPLNVDGTEFENCEDWVLPFKITREEILEYQNRLNLPEPLAPEMIVDNILGWPGQGNPYFFGIHGHNLPDTPNGLAPFHDEDLDGIYDPTRGDYPLFCGDLASWSVFHDAVPNQDSNSPASLEMEIHQLVYATNFSGSPLNTTTFHEYTFINRGQEDLIDLHVGQWMDFDLGCPSNDRFNSVPENNLFYYYNDSAIETQQCFQIGSTTTGTTRPVTIVQILDGLKAYNSDSSEVVNRGMSSISGYGNEGFSTTPVGAGPARNPTQYYNLLTGKWSGGEPITRGGLGFQTEGDTTRFAYDGGLDANGVPWRNCNQPDGNITIDPRVVMSSGPVIMSPGTSNSLTIAVTTTFRNNYDGECPDEGPIVRLAGVVKRVFDEFCASSISTSADPQPATVLQLSVYPNPTHGRINFDLPVGSSIQSLQLFNAAGQRVATMQGNGPTLSYDTKANGLPAGLYHYLVRTGDGRSGSGRVVVR
ncbi:T9SS type A sorting domain-containing protein [Lewinella sp. 4G2]|uniref:T9SS type A sorting domain-containing protein n=1 Tax=Lewinella sp. 4G2 TaxID=1803372 RepID=UPI0018D306EA|nr:T9SS type A sorting domain-containing protein [Lewinella sp. 4G2]